MAGKDGKAQKHNSNMSVGETWFKTRLPETEEDILKGFDFYKLLKENLVVPDEYDCNVHCLSVCPGVEQVAQKVHQSLGL